MKQEIKTIPQVHCEYQQVDRESKHDNLQSSDSEIDPLTQSKALMTEGNTCKRRNLNVYTTQNCYNHTIKIDP